MPPKKGAEEKRILLGRPGNELKSGIVGLANVGKSTLFNAITKTHNALAANFPFATINPQEARVIVPDERFDWLCNKYKPKSEEPAHLTVYDIAGLIRGASKGEGLGNAFLSHIRAVDAIFEVVRCFDDSEIIHTEGDVNPTRDLDIISQELRLKDIEFVVKALENQKKKTRQGGQSLEAKKAREEQATIEKILLWVSGGVTVNNEVVLVKDKYGEIVPFNATDGEKFRINKSDQDEYVINGENLKFGDNEEYKEFPITVGRDVRRGNWGVKEVEVINPLFLLSAKPVVFLINLSEKDYIRKKNKHLAKFAEWIKTNAPGDPVIPISASFEERIADLETEAEVQEECKKLGVESAIPKIVIQMRKVLNLGSFFTSGEDEVRQWSIRLGTKAPQAGGVIHNDFEKTFIQAIVYNFSVLKELGDEAEVKAKGKVMTKGKDYVVEDGDILYIKAGAAKK